MAKAEKECIASWEKFSSKYIPLFSLIESQIAKSASNLPENSIAADFGGGDPNNPYSSSHLLNSLLEKSLKNYSLDIYDINGQQPKNDKITFIKGPIQDTLDKSNYYDFAISINALQTPSIPQDFGDKIHESLKKGAYFALLLPKKISKGIELFQGIEAIAKGYPEGVYERRYNLSNMENYFPKNSWEYEAIESSEFLAKLDKNALDSYFKDIEIKSMTKDFARNFDSKTKKDKAFKSRLLQYFLFEENNDFEPIILKSYFLKALLKKI